ncbi:MAG TPA: Hsp33 family molecular chaperone HslO [Xanthomonadaceae bacterium]|jgi:molecular chaperone Hsp33|nr:Hsp33 family molecular chaperone HslO [Xanthomonadaceae bacterium]
MTLPKSTETTQGDILVRFLLETSGVRGVLVRLNATWRTVLERAPYPPTVAACLGETLAATALMTGHAKIDGRLSVQLRGTGALRSLFAECTRDGTLRGLAAFEEPLPDPLGPRAFGEDSLLAITIENVVAGGRDGMRYQGMVGLDADTMAEAFEGYFAQSEQLPTRMLLAADASHAVGLMLQKLPGSVDDADGWTRAVACFETLGRDELLATSPHELLFRLFHEDGVRVRDQRPLRFGCSCSRERVEAMLQSLGREEALASTMELEPPTAEISCAFCGQTYRLPRDEVLALFDRPATAPGSDTLQ